MFPKGRFPRRGDAATANLPQNADFFLNISLTFAFLSSNLPS